MYIYQLENWPKDQGMRSKIGAGLFSAHFAENREVILRIFANSHCQKIMECIPIFSLKIMECNPIFSLKTMECIPLLLNGPAEGQAVDGRGVEGGESFCRAAQGAARRHHVVD